ncbi:MAG: ABC transporter substrate-binding protein [Spirochaetaceae bacterium]|nr:ABC transporter substrate-binding protein [Spirochaetaceae bacterium]
MKLGKSALVAAAAVILFAACEPKPYRIGLAAQMSGQMADMGVAVRNGALLAAEELNAARKGRRQVELLSRDDHGDPAAAAAIAEEFSRRGVDLVLGHLTSTPTAAALPVYRKAGILVLSPFASSSSLLDGKGGVFLATTDTDAEATSAARLVARSFPGGRGLIVYDFSNRLYSEAWTRRFVSVAAELGCVVAARLPFQETGLTGALAAADSAASYRPDFVMLVANVLDSALFCQRLRLAGGRSAVFFTNWAMTPDFLSNGGEAVEGAVVLNDIDENAVDQASERFRRAYFLRFGRAPVTGAFLGYDALRIAVEALDASGGGEASSVEEAILRGGPFQGLQGPISFDGSGAVVRALSVFRIRDGAFAREGPAP